MSLSKKITLSFLISAFIIAVLAAFIYLNFIKIRKEIRNLELADTIRSTSLQLRRHEKNFFLFGASRSELEENQISGHLSGLQEMMTRDPFWSQNDTISRLQIVVGEYRERFERIRSLISGVSAEFAHEKRRFGKYEDFFPLIEFTFYDRPLKGAEFFEKVLALPPDHGLITSLRELDREVFLLRKNGEDILALSNDLDRTVRSNSERTISLSQQAILIFFPLFLMVGIGTLFLISSSVVRRLGLLIGIVEKTGQGDFSTCTVPEQKWGGDEIGGLIRKFKQMDEQLAERDKELHIKNRELLQSKKLAAIGTLASGVAHELTNPLNNILISTQVLQREAGHDSSPFINEILEDIVSQSMRVKKIVGDLLEYARGKEPDFEGVELHSLIKRVYEMVRADMRTEDVHFTVNTKYDAVTIAADREQIERLFFNLFTNAIEAMKGKGDITVTLNEEKDSVKILVSDTGNGIGPHDVDRIFEPFFTTKDKGTGLGLAIVFNIVQKHRGEIFVESRKDKGMTFCIVFPKGVRGHGI